MRKYALERLQADRIATGHYARLWHRGMPSYGNISGTILPYFVEEAIADAPERDWIASWGMESSKGSTKNDGCFAAPSLLLAGADLTKDQSYFLCGVDGRAFRNVLFPLGELVKRKANGINNGSGRISSGDDKSVRDIAIEAGLPTASKRESMGICFIGKRSFQSFISQYLPLVPQPGNFIDVDTGEVSIIWLCYIQLCVFMPTTFVSYALLTIYMPTYHCRLLGNIKELLTLRLVKEQRYQEPRGSGSLSGGQAKIMGPCLSVETHITLLYMQPSSSLVQMSLIGSEELCQSRWNTGRSSRLFVEPAICSRSYHALWKWRRMLAMQG